MLGLLRIDDLIGHRTCLLGEVSRCFFSKRSRSARKKPRFPGANGPALFAHRHAGPKEDLSPVCPTSSGSKLDLEIPRSAPFARCLAAALHQTNRLSLEIVRKPPLLIFLPLLLPHEISTALHFFRASPVLKAGPLRRLCHGRRYGGAPCRQEWLHSKLVPTTSDRFAPGPPTMRLAFLSTAVRAAVVALCMTPYAALAYMEERTCLRSSSASSSER